MEDSEKSKEELIVELEEARRKIAEFEETERGRCSAFESLFEDFCELTNCPPQRGGLWRWEYMTRRVEFSSREDSDEPDRYTIDAELGPTWGDFVTFEDDQKINHLINNFLQNPIGQVEFSFWTRDFRYITAYGSRVPDGIRGRFEEYVAVDVLDKLSQNPTMAPLVRHASLAGDVAPLRLALLLDHLTKTGCQRSSRELGIIIKLLTIDSDRLILRHWECNVLCLSFSLATYFIIDSFVRLGGAVFRKVEDLFWVCSPRAMAALLGISESEIKEATELELFGEPVELGLSKIERHNLGLKVPVLGKFLKGRKSASGNELMLVIYWVNLVDPVLSDRYFGVVFDPSIIELRGLSHREEPKYKSPAMLAAMERARKVARSDATVLLLGESGSGKNFMARYIHDRSPQCKGPFFTVNCAAIARELIESELFGHVKGAFTGAVSAKGGILEQAAEGTLFLDEIGEIPPPLQAKLLRFLEVKSFLPVGAVEEIKVNARLIVATNRDLEEEVRERRFRKDLYYRLNAITIRVPSLRERPEDIPVLMNQILDEFKEEMPHMDPVCLPSTDVLTQYDWPGNVRELRNALQRSLILGEPVQPGVPKPQPENEVDRTPPIANRSDGSQSDSVWSVGFPPNKSLDDLAKDMKRTLVEEALRRTKGNMSKAARLLGMDRHTVRRISRRTQ